MHDAPTHPLINLSDVVPGVGNEQKSSMNLQVLKDDEGPYFIFEKCALSQISVQNFRNFYDN